MRQPIRNMERAAFSRVAQVNAQPAEAKRVRKLRREIIKALPRFNLNDKASKVPWSRSRWWTAAMRQVDQGDRLQAR
jgi:hypothetical protein